MKTIKDAFEEIPLTGECPIDIEKAVILFDEKCFISRWHDEYSLVRKTHKRNITLKLRIKESDAKYLIDRLSLQETKSAVFKHASSYGMAGYYL